ncbi:lipopolysaccharide biosynthesis protein [Thalassotalea euphylliae]|uniref:Sugar translocase n=1 Tax=Thalassotalea euphylliae TaxID=1655234 RepID=A0A3E0UI14_9GAMM|nr:oligosaccharide flippase family protein [Thalassotalea euphylliae]REL36529.1 sugar translocase [Thalassotalea euphylliae]
MLSRQVKSLLSDSALYGLAIFFMKGISLLMLPVYTHYLSTADYGRLEVLVVFANVFSIFLGFGLVEALYRFVGLAESEATKRLHAGECLLLAMFVGGGAYLVFHFFSPQLATLLPDQIQGEEVYLLGVALALGGIINVPLAWLRITNRARLFFSVTMVKVVIQVGLSFYWLAEGWGVKSILASGAVSSVVVAIWLSVIQIKETGLSVSTKHLLAICNYGWPIFIGGVATFALSGMDRWLLAAHFSAADIATYAIAIKFALVPTLLIQPFTLWWYPKRFSVLKADDGKAVNARFAMLGAVLAVLTCGLLGLVGPSLIRWLTPSDYHGAALILPWLLLCTALKLVAELLNLGCYIDADSQRQMYINLIASAVGAVLLVLLVPDFFINGALAALVIAYTVRVLLFYCWSQRRLALPYQFAYFNLAVAGAFLANFIGQFIEVSPWFGLF